MLYGKTARRYWSPFSGGGGYRQLYFTKHVVAENNILNKINEHNILRKREDNSKFTPVTACHISHDIIDYLMHRIY